MPGQDYYGVPLEELRIDSVHWTEEASSHIRTRTVRYPGRPELDLEPEWATEAALEPFRLVSTTGGVSIEVLGWSRSAPPREGEAGGRILKVWIVPGGQGVGVWEGVSACGANRTDRRTYQEINYG